MAGQHHIAPAAAEVVGGGDNAVGHGIDRVAIVRIATGATVPVLTEVAGRAQAQAAGLVVAIGIGLADGKVESIGQIDRSAGHAARPPS